MAIRVKNMPRDKKSITVAVEIGERPADVDNQQKPSLPKETEEQAKWRGISVQEITEDLAKQLDLEEKEGVLITEVKPGSLADDAGLQEGDVITAINKLPIKNLQDYNSAIEKVKEGSCLLQTSRGFFVLKAK